jgi:internalin A
MFSAVFIFADNFSLSDVKDRNLNIALQASGKTNFSDVTVLELNNSRIVDISPLSRLAKLTSLGLYNNRIVDISSLGSLANLKELDIGRNEITNINSLSNDLYLEKVYIEFNYIRDLTPLQGLANLTELNITGLTVDMNDFGNWKFTSNLILIDKEGRTVIITQEEKNKFGLANGLIITNIQPAVISNQPAVSNK